MRREPALGVPHGGGAVAVERSEVARAVDERIAQRERLRHAHQRLVERGVAVRVEAAHHVADDLRALPVLGVGRQVLLPHRVEDAALDRLQPVAHVGQRAGGDDRQRVVEVARLRRLVERRPLRWCRRRCRRRRAATSGWRRRGGRARLGRRAGPRRRIPSDPARRGCRRAIARAVCVSPSIRNVPCRREARQTERARRWLAARLLSCRSRFSRLSRPPLRPRRAYLMNSISR